MGEAWHAEPLRGTPTRQPHTQPEARELLASAWANLSDGVGPSRDRASDDTAQNAASSCSGSDETAPPGRKESLAQGLAPLTTKSASRSPHSVQRGFDADNRLRSRLEGRYSCIS